MCDCPQDSIVFIPFDSRGPSRQSDYSRGSGFHSPRAAKLSEFPALPSDRLMRSGGHPLLGIVIPVLDHFGENKDAEQDIPTALSPLAFWF